MTWIASLVAHVSRRGISPARAVRSERMRALALSALVLTFGCSKHKSPGDGGAPDLAASAGDLATSCAAPQVMVLLDRTGTMHREIDGTSPADTDMGKAETKIAQAIAAVQTLVSTPKLDTAIAFGLALFPMDPGSCLTLDQILSGAAFMNPSCQAGQIVVQPASGQGATIASSIGVDKTTICESTPTGAGLQTAFSALQSIKQSGVQQYIMLVTDGADFYATCPDPDPLEVLRTLYAAGTKTFIVGFGTQDTTAQGTNRRSLNRMACAGGNRDELRHELRARRRRQRLRCGRSGRRVPLLRRSGRDRAASRAAVDRADRLLRLHPLAPGQLWVSSASRRRPRRSSAATAGRSRRRRAARRCPGSDARRSTGSRTRRSRAVAGPLRGARCAMLRA